MGESECVGGVRDGRVSGGPREGRGVVSNDDPRRAIVFSSGAKDGERREFFFSRRSSRTGHIFFCTSRDRRRAPLARVLIPRAAVPRGGGEPSPATRPPPHTEKAKHIRKIFSRRAARRLANALEGGRMRKSFHRVHQTVFYRCFIGIYFEASSIKQVD